MRLLNTSTLEVEEFLQSRVPEYVILSHTWREEEVTLQDLLSGAAPSKKGYAKLMGCCKKAREDGFKYCWIDTCCIDKASSAELSEAINSMYQWYRDACICYAYLEDYYHTSSLRLNDNQAFSGCRWFTRGWTLQELIAPLIVEFYDASWLELGTKRSLQYELAEITGIGRDILDGGSPSMCTVAVRMSWASRRDTSRLEDEAYCLMGIFGVNMPLLYGEGDRSFIRLQEEILRIDEDYTLLAWDIRYSSGRSLAKSPKEFANLVPRVGLVSDELAGGPKFGLHTYLSKTCFSILPPPHDHAPPRLTSRGLHLTIPIRINGPHAHGLLTSLQYPLNLTWLLCVRLCRSSTYELRHGRNMYERDRSMNGTLELLPVSASGEFRYTSIYLNTTHHIYATSTNSEDDGKLVLRIALDPALLPRVKCISSNLINLQSFLGAQLDLKSLPKGKPSWGDDVELSDTQSLPNDMNSDDGERIAQCLGVLGGNSMELNADVPDLCFCPYGGSYGDIFRFQFIPSVDLDLIIGCSFRDEPSIFARVESTVDFSPTLERWREDLDKNLLRGKDRATVQIGYPTSGGDPGCCIRISLRRAGRIAFAPRFTHYVLEITKVDALT
jgi:hypothetical protein